MLPGRNSQESRRATGSDGRTFAQAEQPKPTGLVPPSGNYGNMSTAPSLSATMALFGSLALDLRPEVDEMSRNAV